MADSIGTVISKGWNDFKANPILIVPCILFYIIFNIYSIAILYSIFPDFSTLLSVLSSPVIDESLFESMFTDPSDLMRFLAVTYIGLFIVSLISIFITAGVIGMSKEIVQTGKTSLRDFLSYSTQYFFKYLIQSILIGIIVGVPIGVLCGIFFIILMLAANSAALVILLVLIFVIIILVLTLVLSLFFYFAMYALILENYGIIDSIQKSYNIFKENKGEVFLFALIVIAIAFGVMLVTNIVTSLLGLIPYVGFIVGTLISIIVSSVLFGLQTIWTVRMYYSLVEEETYESPAAEYDEYAYIEQGILDSDETVVSEEVYEETTAWDDEKRD